MKELSTQAELNLSGDPQLEYDIVLCDIGVQWGGWIALKHRNDRSNGNDPELALRFKAENFLMDGLLMQLFTVMEKLSVVGEKDGNATTI